MVNVPNFVEPVPGILINASNISKISFEDEGEDVESKFRYKFVAYTQDSSVPAVAFYAETKTEGLARLGLRIGSTITV